MSKFRANAGRSGLPATVALAASALILVPSAGLAVNAVAAPEVEAPASESNHFGSFTPASIDPRLAKLVASRADSHGKPMRFTPAGLSSSGERAVTVAVRIDRSVAKAISLRSAIAARTEQVGSAPITVTPTRYDLGISRGYQSFAQPRTTPVLPEGLAKIDIPDLSTFQPSEGAKEKPSRFTARLQLEEKVNAGRAPRTAEGIGNQSVDVAAGFRLTRNLDVTAGLRYQQERDRLDPIVNGEQDSQAVYVGTQFRF